MHYIHCYFTHFKISAQKINMDDPIKNLLITTGWTCEDLLKKLQEYKNASADENSSASTSNNITNKSDTDGSRVTIILIIQMKQNHHSQYMQKKMYLRNQLFLLLNLEKIVVC